MPVINPQNPASGTYLIENEGPKVETLLNKTEVLAQFVNNGLPIVHVFPYKFACMSYLLFDIEEIFMDEAGTKTELQLKVKNIGNGKFELVMTNDEGGMERWEEMHAYEYTNVDGVVTASNSVTVTDITTLKGIGTSTRVLFYTETAPFSAGNPGQKSGIITAISGNTITLDAAITLADGDKMYRGANLRVSCQAIDNQYTLNKRSKYISYFQFIQGRLEFETRELSKDRAVYCMDDATSQILINAKVNALFEGLLKNDFMDVFLYGENVAEDKTAGTAAQTRGLISTIQDAQIANSKTYIVDLASQVGTTDDEKVISMLIEIFIRAFESGYYNQEAITAVINAEQLKHLMYMAPSFEEYFGIQMYRETPTSHEGCRDYVSLRVHGIEIEHGTVEFVMFEALNSYFANTPIMILFPKSMLGMYQRRWTTVDGNLKVQGPDNGLYPRFKFTDISALVNVESGGDECFVYITKLQFALAQAGIYNDAYYVIKNAKSYKTAVAMSTLESAIVSA